MTATDDERTRRDSVWCCRWQTCLGIGVPGFEGGGRPMWCERCQAEEDARATDAPPTGTDAVTPSEEQE